MPHAEESVQPPRPLNRSLESGNLSLRATAATRSPMQPNPLSTSAPGSATFVQAGFARRVRPGLSWELGGGCYAYSGANRNWNYCEAFLGAAWREVTARVHYTPDYLNRGARATYMEVNARHALNERIALVGHVGFWQSDGDGRLARQPASPGHADRRRRTPSASHSPIAGSPGNDL